MLIANRIQQLDQQLDQHQHSMPAATNTINNTHHQGDTSLSAKIQHEIFDKSIEDIERIFNFKINDSTLAPNESSIGWSSGESVQPHVMSKDRKRKYNEFSQKEQTLIEKPITPISSVNNSQLAEEKKMAKTGDQVVIEVKQPPKKARKIGTTNSTDQSSRLQQYPELRQEVRRSQTDKFITNKLLISSLYLQDFNFLRDDLLDELFDLNEEMKVLNQINHSQTQLHTSGDIILK